MCGDFSEQKYQIFMPSGFQRATVKMRFGSYWAAEHGTSVLHQEHKVYWYTKCPCKTCQGKAVTAGQVDLYVFTNPPPPCSQGQLIWEWQRILLCFKRDSYVALWVTKNQRYPLHHHNPLMDFWQIFKFYLVTLKFDTCAHAKRVVFPNIVSLHKEKKKK